jgi:hypothetical protein
MDDYGNELPATTLQQVNKRFNQGVNAWLPSSEI